MFSPRRDPLAGAAAPPEPRACTAQSTSHGTTHLGRFLAVPASLLGPSSSMRRSQGSLYRCTRWCTPAYLFAPAAVLLLGRARRSRWVPLWGLVAVSLFWLPIEFAMLPALAGSTAGWLRRQPGRGHRCGILSVSRAWPLAGIGCTLALDGRDFRVAGVAWAAYAAVGAAARVCSRAF